MNEEQQEGEQIAVEEVSQAETPQGTAVEVRRDKPVLETGEHGFIVPKTLDEAYRMAVAVVKADLAPNSYKNDPSQIMIGIASALEAGLPPLYGLRQIAIIQGRPVIWGDAAIALVQSKNLIEKQTSIEIGSSFDPSTGPAQWPDDFGIRVSLWRRGQSEPYVGQFTVADAKRAGLWMNPKKVPWIQHPKRMMFNRARAFPLRDGFADALAGLAIREEVEDYSTREKVALASPVDDDEPVTAHEMPTDQGETDPQQQEN